jgi:hypothetical protein
MSAPSDLSLREPTVADHETIAAIRNRSYPWDVPADATAVAWSIGRAAVKVEAVRRAQAAGFTHVRTDNHERNAPMLAINDRLGYRRLPAVIELEACPQDLRSAAGTRCGTYGQEGLRAK